jgi:hypothetical protein
MRAGVFRVSRDPPMALAPVRLVAAAPFRACLLATEAQPQNLIL